MSSRLPVVASPSFLRAHSSYLRSFCRSDVHPPRHRTNQRVSHLYTRYLLYLVHSYSTKPFVVWGPDRIRLGFIGAPIATAISFNLIAIFSFLYGVFYVPRTAWHPLSTRCFTNLGVLVQLGLAGVGLSSFTYPNPSFLGTPLFRCALAGGSYVL